jgi:hypothetical protein
MEYKNEKKICQNCKKDFIIEVEDFNFYKKMKVPAPTWCPECRLIRRLIFQNTWNLYWRDCDKCKGKMISRYSPEQTIKVYCPECWWKDDWDGTEYAMDYDVSRPFLEQVKQLIDITPYVSTNSLHSSNKNCDYVNSTAWSKDCYLTFWADYCENVYYSTLINNLKHSMDCIRGYYSELCYESIGFIRCYKMFYSDECDDCIDVWFSRNCYNCQNCIGCVNLSGASYCIFNVKYNKEEYGKVVKDLDLKSWSKIQELGKEAFKFWLTKPYRAYHGHSLNYNVTGDYVYTSKNSKESYILNGAEDCKYCQLITVTPIKDCYDYLGWGDNANRIYEGVSIGYNADSILFSNECWPDAFDLQYCSWSISGKNNFGCVNLKRKQYCILNKQYTKEEFFKLREKIIEDMKVNPYIDNLGRKFYYGEFFPLEFSEFSYNKSNAMRFFPKIKEEAQKEGYGWDDSEKIIGKYTMKALELPDNIEETNDLILKESIECVTCDRPYNIAKGELDLLRKLELPLPHECPKCRENIRFNRMTMPGLYNRNCNKCSVKVRTPYSPDRPEIIYCEKCYQQEVF